MDAGLSHVCRAGTIPAAVESSSSRNLCRQPVAGRPRSLLSDQPLVRCRQLAAAPVTQKKDARWGVFWCGPFGQSAVLPITAVAVHRMSSNPTPLEPASSGAAEDRSRQLMSLRYSMSSILRQDHQRFPPHAAVEPTPQTPGTTVPGRASARTDSIPLRARCRNHVPERRLLPPIVLRR